MLHRTILRSTAKDFFRATANVPEERLATVQKASTLLPRADLDQLLAEERKTPDGHGEFDGVRADIARQTVANAGKDPKLVVPPQDQALVEKLADADKRVSDDLLLGWYHLRRDDLQAAQTWFRKAHDAENSAETAQGLALSLVDSKQPAEAEAVLYQRRDSSDDARKVYLAAVANLLASDPPPQVLPEVLERMSRAVAAARDTPSRQSMQPSQMLPHGRMPGIFFNEPGQVLVWLRDHVSRTLDTMNCSRIGTRRDWP